MSYSGWSKSCSLIFLCICYVYYTKTCLYFSLYRTCRGWLVLCFLKLQCTNNLGPDWNADSISVGLEKGLRCCIPNTLPCDSMLLIQDLHCSNKLHLVFTLDPEMSLALIKRHRGNVCWTDLANIIKQKHSWVFFDRPNSL